MSKLPDELVRAAYKTRYDASEGFLELREAMTFEMSEPRLQLIDSLTNDLAKQTGVTLKIAHEAVCNWILKKGFEAMLKERLGGAD